MKDHVFHTFFHGKTLFSTKNKAHRDLSGKTKRSNFFLERKI